MSQLHSIIWAAVTEARYPSQPRQELSAFHLPDCVWHWSWHPQVGAPVASKLNREDHFVSDSLSKASYGNFAWFTSGHRFLSFCCLSVACGRPFLRRLIQLSRGVSRPHHDVTLNSVARADLQAWNTFLCSLSGKCMFLDNRFMSSDTIKLCTDASSDISFCTNIWQKVGSWEMAQIIFIIWHHATSTVPISPAIWHIWWLSSCPLHSLYDWQCGGRWDIQQIKLQESASHEACANVDVVLLEI